MLLLVLAHWDYLGVVQENVGGHEHRVGEQARIGRDAPGQLVLVAVAAFKQPERGMARQYPGQLGNLGHVGLHPEMGPVWVQAEREKVHGRVHRVLAKNFAVGERGHGVVVHDEQNSSFSVCMLIIGFIIAK